MDESTLLTRVCRFHAFQDDHAVTGGEATVEVSPSESEMKQITNRFLVSFFCKLLLAETSAEIP